MDAIRFDALTRALTSRRTTRKTLLGAGLGLLLAGRRRDAAANCKKVGRSCNQDSDCCKDAECRLSGVCDCKVGFTACSGKCKDLSTNNNHCGACNNECGGGEFCCSGECIADCARGETCCNGACIVGACFPCPIGNEPCGDTCCPPFETCCDDVCVDEVQSNPDHCGTCGNRCGGLRCCSRGECVASFQFDEDNCGRCGFECPRPPRVPNAQTCCSGTCRNLPTDEDHCGACGAECPFGETCSFGVCSCFGIGATCSPLACCGGGECIDLEDNRDHCGRCDRACNNTSICTDGRCFSCPPGRIACGNVCGLPPC
jgi:hypothetical protein